MSEARTSARDHAPFFWCATFVLLTRLQQLLTVAPILLKKGLTTRTPTERERERDGCTATLTRRAFFVGCMRGDDTEDTRQPRSQTQLDAQRL